MNPHALNRTHAFGLGLGELTVVVARPNTGKVQMEPPPTPRRHEFSAQTKERIASGIKRYGISTNSVRYRHDAVQVIGRKFLDVLEDWLTKDELKEMAQKERDEPIAGVCYSHDYCDANMAMDLAWRRLMMRPNLQNDDDIALWTAAWDWARARFPLYL